MFSLSRSAMPRYGLAVAAVVVAVAVRLTLDPFLGDQSSFATLFLAVLFVAGRWGRGPALLAVGLGAAASAWFVMTPRGSFAVQESKDQAELVLYLMVGGGIALLGGSLRTARRAEEENRRAGQHARTILESTTDAVCTFDRAWRFTYVNRQAEALLGQPREDLIGKDHWEEFPATLGTEFERGFRRAMAENVVVQFEEFYPPHDRWYEINAYPSLDGLSVSFRDVTDRRRAEERSRDHAETLSGIFAATVDHVCVIDREGRYRHVSSGVARFLGLEPTEMVGKHWSELGLPEDFMRAFDAQREQVFLSGEPTRHEARYLSPDGTASDFEYSIAPVSRADRPAEAVVVVSRDVTNHRLADRERAELLKRLETRNAFINAVLSQVPAAIVVADASTGRILLSNHEAHRIVRHEYEPGRTLDDYGTTFILEASRPDGSRYGPGDWPLLRAQRGENVVGEDMELVLRDRSRVTIRVNAGPIRVGDELVAAVVAYHDITDRKMTEQAARFLADASTVLAELVDDEATLRKVASLAVPTFADWAIVDLAEADGSIKRLTVAHADPSKANLALEVHRGYPADPAAAYGPALVLRTGRPEFVHECTDERLVASASDENHLRMLRELGLRSYIGVPLRVRGEILGVLGFATAESGRLYKQHDLAVAEDLASRAAIAIENARLYGELKEADRRKNEFLATLAHELRNPLAPIRNALLLMREPATDAESNEAERAMAERQVVHLTRLIDDLMDVARISQGKIELQKQVVDLAAIVNQAVETARPHTDGRSHRVTVRLPDEVVRLNGDPTRLEQILWNLLNNAAKYSEPGCQIDVVVELDRLDVLIRVRDTGIGIKPEMLPRIFEMFIQDGDHRDHSRGGLGIGLSLVRRLVEMHGGSIAVHSAGPGLGSEFVVRLPVSSITPAESEPAKNSPSKPGCGLTRRRILVVDDNTDAARSLARLLTRLYEQEVRVADDGPEALVAVSEFQPEVVLLDIGLPGMSGYEVAEQLRRRPEYEGMLIVALTGWGQEEDRRRSLAAGIDHHLVKPVDVADLEKLLRKLPSGPQSSESRLRYREDHDNPSQAVSESP